MKTNKSYTKRVKVTKSGKLLVRKPGGNHFNAKQTRTRQQEGKRAQTMTMKNKARGRFLPNAA